MNAKTRTRLKEAARHAARALANINGAIACLSQAADTLAPITAQTDIFEDRGRCLADFKLGVLRARLKLSQAIGDIPEEAWAMVDADHAGAVEARAAAEATVEALEPAGAV